MSNKNENKAMRLEMVRIDQSEFAAEILRGNANVNLTQMAKPFGRSKRPANWLKAEETKCYLGVLAVATKRATADLLEVRQGIDIEQQGTWCTDYRIAMRFAQWLSPEFSIAVDDMLVKLVFGEAALVEPMNGVCPLIYEGKAWYNYRDILSSYGLSRRSSARDRKNRYPEHFKLIYGRNFITPHYVKLLNGYYGWKQLRLDFDNPKELHYGTV
jgi:KilA-N domain.